MEPLDEAKSRILALFADLKATYGMDVMIYARLGGPPELLVECGDDIISLGNADWHPEWSA